MGRGFGMNVDEGFANIQFSFSKTHKIRIQLLDFFKIII